MLDQKALEVPITAKTESHIRTTFPWQHSTATPVYSITMVIPMC